jgi:peptidoglycan hydrolase-like protein with peptidoglycan-binding domain
MNKKIIKLTESDLINIVKKVLNEQSGSADLYMDRLNKQQLAQSSFISSEPKKIPFEKINPKNLKFGDRGEDVKILQQKLFDRGLLKTKSMKPTGYFGDLTQSALSKALGKPISNTKITTPLKTKTTTPLKTKTTKSNNLVASSQVKSQLKYLQNNNYLSSEKFTIVDDKNSKVYAFQPGYILYKTYSVITGKNKGDQLKTQTMTDWAIENWTDVGSKFFSSLYDETKNLVTGNKSKNPLQVVSNYIDHCYFSQNEWKLKNTPSGIFKRAGNVTNFMNDLLATTFVEEDYGARFITWQTCDGTTIPFGFHGTKSAGRLKNLPGGKDYSKKQCTNRKMSFGCINFGDEDIKEISSFIDAGQISIWLPDMSNDIVEIPKNCLNNSNSSNKNTVNRYDEYKINNKWHMDTGKI